MIPANFDNRFQFGMGKQGKLNFPIRIINVINALTTVGERIALKAICHEEQ